MLSWHDKTFPVRLLWLLPSQESQDVSQHLVQVYQSSVNDKDTTHCRRYKERHSSALTILTACGACRPLFSMDLMFNQLYCCYRRIKWPSNLWHWCLLLNIMQLYGSTRQTNTLVLVQVYFSSVTLTIHMCRSVIFQNVLPKHKGVADLRYLNKPCLSFLLLMCATDGQFTRKISAILG